MGHLLHMRNILAKFKIHYTTYIFFLFTFLCGYFKQSILIFVLLFVHELGHIFMIVLCHYSFIKVEFFPFGGITTIDKPINSSIYKEILISLAGVFMQILFSFLVTFCFSFDNSLFHTYNLTLILFNLLPIIPLDGSIFIHSLFEKIFSYQMAYLIYEICSIFFLFLFFLYNLYTDFNNYFICFVLFFQFFIKRKEKKYLIHRFYLERYLNHYPYRKILSHQRGDIRLLKKETLHFFSQDNHFVHEKELLKKIFSERH